MHTLVYKTDLQTQQATSWCPTPAPPPPPAPPRPPPPPAPLRSLRDGRDFNFKKLKSLGEIFFSSYGGEEGGAVSGNQRRGHGIIQVKTIIII